MHAEPPARLLVIGTPWPGRELIDNPDETDDLLRLGLHRLPIGGFPLLRSLAPVLATYDGAIDLGRGLDIVLPGLTTALTLRPSAPTRANSASRPEMTSTVPGSCNPATGPRSMSLSVAR